MTPRWLARDTARLALTPLQQRVLTEAHACIGEGEDPPGSNRGDYPDYVNRLFGSPLASYWCANAVGHWWKAAGAELPPRDVGSCDAWLQWALRTGRFGARPAPGAAALYGTMQDCNHIALVFRVVTDPSEPDQRRVVTVDGNTSLERYDRNGWVVDMKALNRERLVGYVHLLPLPPGVA